jgi:PAS domain S-box-containing protein
MQLLRNVKDAFINTFLRLSYEVIKRDSNEVTMKELLKQLKRNADELEQNLENISDMFYILNKDMVVTYANSAAKNFLGQELVGKHLSTIASNNNFFQDNFRKAITEKQSICFESIGPISGKWIEVNLYPAKDGGLSVFFKDITEKKKLESQIVKQKEHLESIVNNISDCFYALDKNLNFTFCNSGTKIFFGFDPTGKNIWTCLPGIPLIIKNYQKVLEDRKPHYFEMQSVINNRWVGINLYPANDGGLSVFFRDIEESRKVSENLKQANEHFLKLFNLNPNLMMIVSANEKRYFDVNDAFVKRTGIKREEIIGYSIDDIDLLADTEQRAEIEKLFLKQGFITNYELKYRCGDTIRVGLLTIEKIEIGDKNFFMNVITDITDKKRLDEELARFESLNIVGEMAASIGHEVRNPMTTVRGYLQVFQLKPPFSKYRESFGVMIDELDRANSIITEFLSLAKNKAQHLKQSDLNSIINTIFPLVQADALHLGIDIEKILLTIPPLLLDENEIRQVLLNLVRNAFEAMDRGGKTIIKTYCEECHVVLEISDSGKGIPQEIINKLGTPFVTTKENGTGLGLAVCYRVAQRHNAKISINTSNAGTSFKLKFPVSTSATSKIS